MLAETQDVAVRTPYFCSGCPHNSSTVVPEGMRAYAGIGCHYMAQWMDRSTLGYTQMGGEGANWIGEAPFSKRHHVFQNLGDGTYNHSGYMAIRAAIAAGINITYKILFNDAVAMTGGQPNDGGLTVPQVARQVAAEGAKRVVVVTDEPWKYAKDEKWPSGLTIHHRDDLNTVQKELAEVSGVTALIYDQTCAAEKRRRRKRGLYPDPDKRVIINELVCEGCGDCGVQSNCVSVQPLGNRVRAQAHHRSGELQQGFLLRQRLLSVLRHGAWRQAQSGFRRGREHCVARAAGPQIAGDRTDIWDHRHRRRRHRRRDHRRHSRHGGASRRQGRRRDRHGGPRAEGRRGLQPHAHRENPEDIHAIRVAAGGADLVLGGDIVVAGNKKVLAAVKPGKTEMVINLAEFLPGDFTRNADFSLPTERLKRAIATAAGRDISHFLDASKIATNVVGKPIAANMIMVGYAYQIGALPLSAEAIEQAIELNGEDVATNQAAFLWGRRAAHDLAAVEALAKPKEIDPARQLSQSFEEMVSRRVAYLTAYQNASYAARYRVLVEKVKAAEAAKAPGKCGLAEAAARYLFKLMAYKDEYEVARLYTDGAFAKAGEGGVRRRSQIRVPSCAAAAGAARCGNRLAAQDDVRPVDDARVRGAGEIQVPARHGARSVRL